MMFVLAKMKDTVTIPPWMFHIKLNQAVVEALNKKFANRVKIYKHCAFYKIFLRMHLKILHKIHNDYFVVTQLNDREK